LAKARQDHASLIKRLIDHFTESGLEIQYANYENYGRPYVIKRHAPDVIAYNKANGLAYIGEAKMCGELTAEITRQQFEDFSKTVMKSGKSGAAHLPFFIAVPNECSTKITQTFRDFEIPLKENVHILGF
jgi:hypothetical protein